MPALPGLFIFVLGLVIFEGVVLCWFFMFFILLPHWDLYIWGYFIAWNFFICCILSFEVFSMLKSDENVIQ